MRIWDAPHETIDRDAARGPCSCERLQATVARLYEHVPHYRERLAALGAEPGDVRELDDLRRLPFTTKTDFRDRYPYGLFATPLDDVVEVHSSSGTTGKPVVAGFTRRDLETWAELVCRLAVMAGVRARRRRPGLVRLRHVHRRLRPPLRPPACRGHRAADVGRQHRAAAAVHAGLRHYRAGRHAVVRALPRRVDPGARRSRRLPAAARALRRRGLQRGDAAPDREPHPHPRHRQLRPHRGHGAGRLGRVRVPRRHARRRGPLHRRGRRPGDR